MCKGGFSDRVSHEQSAVQVLAFYPFWNYHLSKQPEAARVRAIPHHERVCLACRYVQKYRSVIFFDVLWTPRIAFQLLSLFVASLPNLLMCFPIVSTNRYKAILQSKINVFLIALFCISLDGSISPLCVFTC